MIVPGGGISLDGERWIACRPGFFLPVRVLSRLFRSSRSATARVNQCSTTPSARPLVMSLIGAHPKTARPAA
jgi:hypothetical protein